MNALLFLITFTIGIVITLLVYYEPKIEIVVFIKHYKVYIWYNKWDHHIYRKERVYKLLFEI